MADYKRNDRKLFTYKTRTKQVLDMLCSVLLAVLVLQAFVFAEDDETTAALVSEWISSKYNAVLLFFFKCT